MVSRYRLGNVTRAYSRIKERFSRAVHDTLLHGLAPGADIVEFGPGEGHFSRESLRRGYRYVGVEGSRFYAEQRLAEGARILRARLPLCALANDSADAVFSSMVLEHMGSPAEAVLFVEEASRVVRPGGTIVLMFPNAYANGPIFWEMDYTHGYFTTPRRVCTMCEHRGLEVVAVHRAIHWLWIRSTPLHTTVRIACNVVMSVANWAPVAALGEALGLGGILYRLRKSIFETTIVVARRPGDVAPEAGAGSAAHR